jgi:translocation and assembly module TamB
MSVTVGGAAWLDTQAGKTWVESMLNDAAAGRARVTAIGGTLPFHPAIGRIELLDPQGAWANLADVHLDLKPWDLLRRRLTIERLSAAAVDVVRSPQREAQATPEEPSTPGFEALPLNVDLQSFTLGTVRLPAELLGEQTTWTVKADAQLIGRNARLDVAAGEMAASPVRIDLRFELSGRRVGARAAIDDPRGVLLRRELGASLPLQIRLADADGTPHGPADWNGRLTATVADRGRLDAVLHLARERDARVFGIDGTFDGARLLPARLAPLIGQALDFHLAARAVDGSGIALDGLTLKTDAVQADGTGLYHRRGNVADASLRVEFPDLSRLSGVAGQPLAGAADLSLTAKGPLDALRAELALHGTSLAYADHAVDDVSARVAAAALSGHGYDVKANGELTGMRSGAAPLPALLSERVTWALAGHSDASIDQIALSEVRLASGGVELAGSGTFDRRSQDVAGTLRLDLDDLARSAEATGFHLKGHGQVVATVDGNLSGRATVNVHGGLDDLASGIPVADALIGGQARLDANASRNANGTMTLQQASLRLAHARLKAAAAADPTANTVAGKVDASVDDLAVLRQAGLPAGGRLALTADISGSPAAPTLDVRADGADLAWAGARIDRAMARLRANTQAAPSGSLTAELRARDAVVTVNGDAALSADRKTFTLTRLHIDSGRNHIDAQLRTALDTLLTRGQVTADLPDIRPLSQLAGLALGGRMTLKVGLTAQRGQAAELAFAADELSAAAAGAAPIRVHHLAASGRLTDLLRQPAGQIQVTGDGLGTADAELRTLRASARSSQPDRFTVEADVEGDVRGPFAITTAGDIDIGHGTTRARVTRLAGRIADTPVHLQHPLLVTAHGPELAVEGLGLSLGSGTIEGDAKFAASSLAARLEAHRLPVGVAGQFAGRPDLGGTIDAHVEIAGPATRPRGRIAVEGHDLRAGRTSAHMPPAGFAIEAALAPARVELTASATAAGHQLISASGAVPMVFGPKPGMTAPARDRAMDMRLRGEGDLGELADFLPLAGDRLAGHFRLAFDVGGTLAHPQLTGDLALDHGRYENIASGLTVDDVTLDIGAERDRVLLQRLTATDGGKGRLTGSGTVILGGDVPTADLTLSLTGFQALRRSDASMTASGSTTVKGKLNAAVVVTRLTIDQAELFIPDPPPSSAQKIPVTVVDSSTGEVLAQPTEPQPSASGGTMLLDIAVHVPGRTFVRGRGLDSEWQGDVQVRGTAAAPEITGALNVTHGTLSFFGKDMTLTRGTVSFTGGHKIEPDLDVLAETTTSDGTFNVGAAGTPEHLKITLSSTPAMPQDEILSRLIFGRDVTRLTPAEGVQLAQAAATLSSGGPGVLDKVRHKLGLDVLNIGSMNDNDSLQPSPQADSTGGNGGMGNTGVSGGKYIANGVYVGAEQGLSGETRTKVQVEVLPHVNIESAAGTRSEDVGVNWQTDY